MDLTISLNTTDYSVKRGTTVIGSIKKLANGSIVFVSGVQITHSANSSGYVYASIVPPNSSADSTAEVAAINTFMVNLANA